MKIRFQFGLSSFGKVESIEYGINIHLTKSESPADKDIFIYNPSNTELKRPFNRQQYFKFSFVGFQETEYIINAPGVYEMKITLRPRARNYIKPGTTMNLKYDKPNNVLTLDTGDRKIKFTTRKCE